MQSQGMLFLGLIYSRYSLYPPYPHDVPNNLYLLKGGIDTYWFLTCMFLAYSLYAILKKVSLKYIVYVVLIYVLLAYACSYLPILLPWSIDTSFVCSILIWLGTIVRYMTNKESKKGLVKLLESNWIVYFGVSVFFMTLTNIFKWGNLSIGYYGKYGMGGVIIFILIGVLKPYIVGFLFKKMENLVITRVFSYVGKQSLRLMCIHLVIFKLLGVTSGSSYIISLMAILIALFMAYLIEKFTQQYNNGVLKYL